jgi:outer membrane protein OmpA-like peptidoglycan-associated protein
MRRKWLVFGAGLALLFDAGCAAKRLQGPAAPAAPVAQNIFVLLPNPGEKAGGIVVKNEGGSQELTEAFHAIRVERSDVAPSAPFVFDETSVKQKFGALEDNMPAAELIFILNFDENKDVLMPESEARLPEIFTAIRERRSTLVTVTGHTDATGSAQLNDRLAMSRAQNVAKVLQDQGLDSSSLFVTSHGASDQFVKTAPGIPEPRNRRVEVIVR